MNLFVSGLCHNISVDQLYALFDDYANVKNVKIIQDVRDTKPKIYGLIEIPDDQEAKNAIRELDGRSVSGRIISVKRARTKKNH